MVAAASGGVRPLLCQGRRRVSAKTPPTSARLARLAQTFEKPSRPKNLSRGICGSSALSEVARKYIMTVLSFKGNLG
jgi:hypothetical protein